MRDVALAGGGASIRNGRFVVLDGLRGVAALAVVLTHGKYTPSIAIHAGEAVDFFFVLSGLVIAEVYAGRLASGALSPGRFALMRIVRLYPMIAFAMLVGAALTVMRLASWGHLRALPDAVLATAAGLLLIPIRPEIPDIASALWSYPLCPPAWSIFYEGVANAVYTVVVRHVTAARLLAVIAFSGAGLAHAIFVYGGGSFGPIWPQVGSGFWRIGYSFSMGLMIHKVVGARRSALVGNRYAWLLAAVLFGACCLPIPYADPATRYVDAALALGLMPLIVLAGSQVQPGPGLARACDFLGRLSYPLYLSHIAVIQLWWTLAGRLHFAGSALYGLAALQVVAALLVGTVVMKVFDEPVRARLGAWLLSAKGAPVPAKIPNRAGRASPERLAQLAKAALLLAILVGLGWLSVGGEKGAIRAKVRLVHAGDRALGPGGVGRSAPTDGSPDIKGWGKVLR